MKIYTRTGDQGQTSLRSGTRVDKDSLRIEAYGTVDELNSFLGYVIATISSTGLKDRTELVKMSKSLMRIQGELFEVGSELAVSPDLPEDKYKQIVKKSFTIDNVNLIEQEIDSFEKLLPTLKHFILPGGSILASQLHICRTVCRRSERRCVSLSKVERVNTNIIKYLNRLSDWLFTAARFSNHIQKQKETQWSS